MLTLEVVAFDQKAALACTLLIFTLIHTYSDFYFDSTFVSFWREIFFRNGTANETKENVKQNFILIVPTVVELNKITVSWESTSTSKLECNSKRPLHSSPFIELCNF